MQVPLQRQASDHFSQYFDQQEEEVLSAADIKKRAKALIDSKVRPKKIKKSKK